MEYLRLTTGLLLPWVAGYYWLAAIESRFNTHKNPNTLRQIGYGLFLGYAAIQGLVLSSAALLDRVEFWPVITAVALLGTVGFLLSRTRPETDMVYGCEEHPATAGAYSTFSTNSKTARLLLIILLCGATLHLALNTLEILNRPVYPWDAWLAWVYRAKAWFYSGNVYQLASPAEWLAGTTTAPYTIAANGYPTFASIIPFWAALSLGEWSETLVNTPVLCCGIALGLGVYGQCREYGISPLLSMAAAYFLLSIPLVGTHLSLAGYADIWLAGFTGLGFAALIPALAHKNKFQILLGLGMVALGIGVKNEGVVWFYLALSVALLATIRTRIVLSAAALVLILGTIAWWADFTYLTLPILGPIGLLDGAIHIPLVGSHHVRLHNVLGAYFNSFFTFGNWHLLWTCLIIVAASLFFIRKAPAAKVITLFLVIFLASQAFIFGLTEQGRWATSYTAINRLPLHFAPALVLCLFICLHHLLMQAASKYGSEGNANPHKLKVLRYSLPAIFSALLVATSITFYLLPENSSSAEPMQFAAKDLRLVVGGGQIRNNTAHVTGYRNGFAVASSGPISLNAADFPILSYDLTSSNPKPPSFFWRLASRPGDIEIIDIESNTGGTLRLSDQTSWKEKITEIGVTFYGNQQQTAQVRQLALIPDTLAANAEALWSGWTAFEPWTQTSVNWRSGGRQGSTVTAHLLLASWLLVAFAVYLVMVRVLPTRNTSIVVFSLCILIAWSVLDTRWIVNRLEQARITLTTEEIRGKQACIDIQYDCTLPEIADRIRDNVPAEQNDRILIVYENPRDNFRALRMKYRLLPLPAMTHLESVVEASKGGLSYALLLKQIQLAPDGQSRGEQQATNTLWDTPESLFLKLHSRD